MDGDLFTGGNAVTDMTGCTVYPDAVLHFETPECMCAQAESFRDKCTQGLSLLSRGNGVSKCTHVFLSVS